MGHPLHSLSAWVVRRAGKKCGTTTCTTGAGKFVTFECRLSMQVRAHYRTVPYHNFFHCVDVTHATFRCAVHLHLACSSSECMMRISLLKHQLV